MKQLVPAIAFVLGLTVLGCFIRSAAISFKELDRTVVVKGLAEREIEANLVIWPIKFSVSSNDLKVLQNELDGHTQLVLNFLAQQGIESKDIIVSNSSITDKLANAYVKESEIKQRYLGSKVITVRSEKIAPVSKAMIEIDGLIKNGLVLNKDDYQARTLYSFTGLNDIKPAMIKQATEAAREVAEKFAQDSQSKLGKIKSAQQGIFSIDDRDEVTPQVKKVRVVSTVEYYLND